MTMSMFNRLMLTAILSSMMVACAQKQDNTVDPRVVRVPPKASADVTNKEKTQVMPVTADAAKGAATTSTSTTIAGAKTEKVETKEGDKSPEKSSEAAGSSAAGSVAGSATPVKPAVDAVKAQAADVKNDKADKKVTQEQTTSTGQKVQTNAFYGAASDDYLVRHLTTELMKNRDDAAKAKIYKAAASVLRMESKVDRSTNDVLVTVLIKGDKKNTTLKLGGTLNAKGYATLLEENGLAKGRLDCMDLDQKFCRVQAIELELGKDKTTLMAILRKTKVNISLKTKFDEKGSEDFKQLVGLFENTEKNKNVGNSIKSAIVESAEIISGRNLMRLSILSQENQVVSVHGPMLLIVKELEETNVILAKDVRTETFMDQVKESEIRESLLKKIIDARLTRIANGKDMTVQLDVMGTKANERSTVEFTLERLHLPILDKRLN